MMMLDNDGDGWWWWRLSIARVAACSLSEEVREWMDSRAGQFLGERVRPNFWALGDSRVQCQWLSCWPVLDFIGRCGGKAELPISSDHNAKCRLFCQPCGGGKVMYNLVVKVPR